VLRKPLVVALNVAVVIAVVGGTAAFANADKHVTLVVDGHRHAVSTYADTVGALLAEQGVRTQPRDVVAPDAQATLVDGSEVAVRFARPITLDLDGATQRIWTTAATVDDLLEQLNLRNQGAVVSASRSQGLALSGARLRVRLPDTLVIRHDGWRTLIVTAAPTVGAAVRQSGIHLGPLDRASVPLSTLLTHRQVVTVTRVKVLRHRSRVALPFRIIRRPDPALYQGDTELVRAGQRGLARVEVRVRLRDGRVVHRHRTIVAILRPARPQTVRFGTKERPTWTPTPSGLNWAALARCESGGNPLAVNPAGYYGLYQFALGTWYGVGGAGNPIYASVGEQTYRAELLYSRSGSAPWPVCGYLLYS